ncbi:MAG: Hsp70 family protein, partial [Micrococcales bacterium]|nr:Hsp70 family protein [Micrococcales bacterium]
MLRMTQWEVAVPRDKAKQAGWVLAVDFGTSNTGAAVRFADGRVEKVALPASPDTMPSAVVYRDGQPRAGKAALNCRRTHSKSFIAAPKSHLGHESVFVGEREVPPAEIASHVLAVVRERAIRAAGGSSGSEPDWVVLTHPVWWTPTHLADLRAAAELAGFAPETIRTVGEPVAALYSYVTPASLDAGSRVAVVDVGGGTSDVAILEVTGDLTPGAELAVVAQRGLPRLGGNDLDELAYQWVRHRLMADGRNDLV